MTDSFCLFSGGRDSLVVTHKAMTQGKADTVIYLDTSSGLPQNREWIESTCRKYGWPLEVLEPTTSLEEFAKRYGFPKGGSHSWAMRYFKEHSLGRRATECDGRPRFYSGVYADESQTRMDTVDSRTTKADRWDYVAPCHDWSDEDFEGYIADHGLTRNPHAKALGRSPDCYCLAYGSRDEVLVDLRANGYNDHADHLLDLEKAVQAEIGTDKDYCWLGSEGLSSPRLRALKAEADGRQTTLCGRCGKAYPDRCGDTT